jgi:hypothetical protein
MHDCKLCWTKINRACSKNHQFWSKLKPFSFLVNKLAINIVYFNRVLLPRQFVQAELKPLSAVWPGFREHLSFAPTWRGGLKKKFKFKRTDKTDVPSHFGNLINAQLALRRDGRKKPSVLPTPA